MKSSMIVTTFGLLVALGSLHACAGGAGKAKVESVPANDQSANQQSANQQSANHQSANHQSAGEQPANKQIDYEGFVQLAAGLQDVRTKHRVSIERFNEMAKDPKTLILDTRSKAAFDDVHIKGAVHLNFSDFTAGKLAKVIPSKDTRILIYCNNNFEAQRIAALIRKGPPLALNIPTFVNLHGYGYTNVFELANVLKIDDPRVDLEGKSAKIRQLASSNSEITRRSK